MPEVLKQATVAIEDERFYKHKGVDYEGIIRAAVKNATNKDQQQGGSTLTMQLVRNLYTPDDTRAGIEGYKRKIREARLARDLEETHSKDWVLGKYLNTRARTAPYGGQTAIGAGAAARLYFNKRVQDLTLREAAMLAGMPQAPSELLAGRATRSGTKAPPQRGPGQDGRARARSPGERAQTEMAKGLGLHMDRYFARARERYVLDYVKSELIKEYGRETVRRGGFRVYTTINLKYQQWARKAIADNLAGVGPVVGDRDDRPQERRHRGDGVSSPRTYGQVEVQPRRPGPPPARLGVQDHGADDRAARGREPELDELRLALADGAQGPAVRLAGAPVGGQDLRRQGRRQHEPASRRRCAPTTRSTPSSTADLGPDKVKETARMMGIKSKLMGYCAESLGGLEDGVSPLEMANAYATIANGGYRNRPRVIRKITTREGKTLKLPRALARAPHEGVLGRRDLRGDQDPAGTTSPAAPAATRRSAAPRAARPARPTRTSTPGSSASRRGSRPPSGSASPAAPGSR